jgi:hypothetical protein
LKLKPNEFWSLNPVEFFEYANHHLKYKDIQEEAEYYRTINLMNSKFLKRPIKDKYDSPRKQQEKKEKRKRLDIEKAKALAKERGLNVGGGN